MFVVMGPRVRGDDKRLALDITQRVLTIGVARAQVTQRPG